jgi:hypothetical protein
MKASGKEEDTKARRRSLLAAGALFSAAMYVLLIWSALFEPHKRDSGWHVAYILFLLAGMTAILLPMLGTRVLLGTLGTIGYVEITDATFEQRIRKRYAPEMDQLTSLGFGHLFFEGETTSVFRLLLIFPAIIKLMMLGNGAVITVGPGWKFVAGSPILGSRDKTAFSCVGSLGVKFRTAFKNGTILESKAFGDDMPTGPTIVRHCYKGESIRYTWEQHKKGVQLLETEGNPVIRDLSFQAWVGMIRKVSADMREHL